MRPHLLALVLLVAPLAGCVIEGPPGVQEGAHAEVPIRATGERPLRAKGMDVQWVDPVTGVGKTFGWNVTEERWRDGVYHVGNDRLLLRYRVDEPLPVKLRHDEDLSRQNSFNLTYREDPSIGGRVLTRVLAVDPESYLDARTDDFVTRDVAGDFVLKFTATCDAEDDGCAEPGEAQEVRLIGVFPPRRH